MLDNYSPSFEFAKQRNRKLLEDTHELGAILAKLKAYYKEYQDNQATNDTRATDNVLIANQPDSISTKFQQNENRSLQSASKYSDSQDDLLHPLPPEMSTDLKSDAVNFSKKEKSPEPAPVKKMMPLKMPISPLATNPPVKSPTPPAVKSPISSSVKSPLSSLARAEQLFSQSSSSETESETEASTQQQPKPTNQNQANPALDKSVDEYNNVTHVEVDNSSQRSSKMVSNELVVDFEHDDHVLDHSDQRKSTLGSERSTRSSKKVSVIDPPNELVEEVAILDFDHSSRRKSLSPASRMTPPDLHRHRAEILETVNMTRNTVKGTPTPDASLSPRRKSTAGSRVSQLASENSSRRGSQVSGSRKSEDSAKKSNDPSRRSTVGSSLSPRNTGLSRKSHESQHSEKSKTSGRNPSINSGIKLLEIKSPRSRESSARDSARSSIEEALSSKRGFIRSGDEISPRSNSPRKSLENPKMNSARSSLKSGKDARHTGSEQSTRRQSNAKIVAEILELSEDDEEKPWYDVQPKTNERKSKLFASSFNALEDDEDSFSYE